MTPSTTSHIRWSAGPAKRSVGLSRVVGSRLERVPQRGSHFALHRFPRRSAGQRMALIEFELDADVLGWRKAAAQFCREAVARARKG